MQRPAAAYFSLYRITAYSSTYCPRPFSFASSRAFLPVTRSSIAMPVASNIVISPGEVRPLIFPAITPPISPVTSFRNDALRSGEFELAASEALRRVVGEDAGAAEYFRLYLLFARHVRADAAQVKAWFHPLFFDYRRAGGSYGYRYVAFRRAPLLCPPPLQRKRRRRLCRMIQAGARGTARRSGARFLRRAGRICARRRFSA